MKKIKTLINTLKNKVINIYQSLNKEAFISYLLLFFITLIVSTLTNSAVGLLIGLFFSLIKENYLNSNGIVDKHYLIIDFLIIGTAIIL